MVWGLPLQAEPETSPDIPRSHQGISVSTLNCSVQINLFCIAAQDGAKAKEYARFCRLRPPFPCRPWQGEWVACMRVTELARGRTLSDTDSFIEEVTEEVRREKLFGMMRRYGWIPILLVVLLVAGAAYNEYRKASIRSAAEAAGDSILAAMDGADAATRESALNTLDQTGSSGPVIALLAAGEALNANDPEGAAAALKAIADDTSQPALYRDLATLKWVILSTAQTAPADRITALTPLTAAGAPFRVLAEEQIALAEIEQGETAAALTRLRALMEDNEASQGLQRRVSQLIVALGGEVAPA